MVKNNLPNFAGFVSCFQLPVFLSFLKFLISHVAHYAPSSKFQNCSKIQGKIEQLIFAPLLR